MNVLAVILAFIVLGAVILVVGAPLRAARRAPSADPGAGGDGGRAAENPDLERDELEAEREAKYREIRDAELDFRTGKLAREDYDAIDRELRAEALQILDRIERHERAQDGEGDEPELSA